MRKIILSYITEEKLSIDKKILLIKDEYSKAIKNIEYDENEIICKIIFDNDLEISLLDVKYINNLSKFDIKSTIFLATPYSKKILYNKDVLLIEYNNYIFGRIFFQTDFLDDLYESCNDSLVEIHNFENVIKLYNEKLEGIKNNTEHEDYFRQMKEIRNRKIYNLNQERFLLKEIINNINKKLDNLNLISIKSSYSKKIK